jgi:pilus assembly protein CpaF
MSVELILPFIRDLEPHLADEEVSEIMVNANGAVFIERHGLLESTNIVIPEENRQSAARNIARLLDSDISEKSPLLDARLPDGSRVAAVMPPASVGGTILNIRKFRSKLFTGDELVRREMLTREMLHWLIDAMDGLQTILISGGTGSGKTTLLNALAAYLPQLERIVVIEDTAEISIAKPNVVRLEARRAQGDVPAVTIRDLLRQTLRLRPDRIILGEVRGAEAFDLLQAMNTGHQGTLSTIHANSAGAALSRFRTCIAMAGVMPVFSISPSVAEGVQVVVHLGNVNGQRRILEVLRVLRYDGAKDQYEFEIISE